MTTTTTNPKYVRVGSSKDTINFENEFDNMETGASASLTQHENSTPQEPQLSPHEQAKLQHWNESSYAVGLVETTWSDELQLYNCKKGNSKKKRNPCMFLSAFVCSRLNAKRVGNMSVLKESTETILEDVECENGELEKRRVSRRIINVVVGPYWPMMVLITYPSIIVVSFFAGKAIYAKGSWHPLFIVFWLCSTLGVCFSLFGVAFRDPGIMMRHRDKPATDNLGSAQSWKWNDHGQTFRPRGAVYDPDCAVVIEGYDHVCPWTGTAIGKKNMSSFMVFVCLVFVCFTIDMFIMMDL